MDRLQAEIQAELDKFSVDVKHYADYQTGLRSFYPWLLGAEEKVNDGVVPPVELVSACNLLGDCKNFQDDCETRIIVLDEANIAAGKMTNHEYAENNIQVSRKAVNHFDLTALRSGDERTVEHRPHSSSQLGGEDDQSGGVLEPPGRQSDGALQLGQCHGLREHGQGRAFY